MTDPGDRSEHEAGVLLGQCLRRSHATLYRAETVLAARDAKIARPVLRTPGEVQRDEAIAKLRKRLRDALSRNSELQGKVDALATMTANLYFENRELKKKQAERSSDRVAVLPATGPWKE